MARRCYGRPKKLKVKNWKEAAKDRRTLRDLAEKAKIYKGLKYQMMMMMMIMIIYIYICIYICNYIMSLTSFTRSTNLSLYQFVLHVGPNCEVESRLRSSSAERLLTSIYSSLQYFLFVLTRRHTADFCF
jgi:hypothetical protein